MKLLKSDLFEAYPALEGQRANIIKCIDMIENSMKSEGKLLTMGNGGSSADAEHLCGELQKGFLSKRPLSQKQKDIFKNIDPSMGDKLQGGLPAISLVTMHASISAFSNDVDPNYAFAQQIWALSLKQDIIMGFSTSGNSKNVVNGLNCANAMGIKTIALTGSKESKCSEVADLTIYAPSEITHKVQEFHLPIYHALCIELEERFFPSKEML